ncbi:MAG: glycosyltransferase family 2 protein [Anaerolineae bacterium]|nr:glycosyltransferase family 2 protein [Anaerolineae bacterium]
MDSAVIRTRGWRLSGTDTNQPGSVFLSVVIPVYNEEQSLQLLFERLTESLAPLGLAYEIVFVDDGSSDSSLQILRQLVAEHATVVLLEQRRNFGKSAALNAGFSLARGDAIITMDADLQDDPEGIRTLLERLGEGYDLVTGWRVNRWKNDPLTKTIPSRIANSTTRIMSGIPLHDMNSGFKCYRAEVVRNIHLHSDLHRYIPVLAHYRGFKVTEVPIEHFPRQYGQSKYGAGRFLRSMFDLITVLFLSRFRYRPLHLFGLAGAISAGVGLIISFYLSLVWLFTDDPIGDRPLLLLGVLLIIVGVQFVSIGLIADLVVSIERHYEDPQSTVRKIYRHDSDD